VYGNKGTTTNSASEDVDSWEEDEYESTDQTKKKGRN